MTCLADLPELVGFFSYSRDDDEGSMGALSALRDVIQRELSAQLGRTKRNFRLWQDREAIAPGKLWESQIRIAIEQSVFFIPIVTPRTVKSGYCKREFEAFLAREGAIGRNDLVFPILYMTVAGLENEERWRADPVLEMIGRRQYVDWRTFRHRRMDDTEVREAIERFCNKIVEALSVPLAQLPESAATSAAQPSVHERETSDQPVQHSRHGQRPADAPSAPPSRESFPPEAAQIESGSNANIEAERPLEQALKREADTAGTAAFDPAAYGVASLMAMAGVFTLIFGVAFIFLDIPVGRGLELVVVVPPVLVLAAAMLATALGTMDQRKWARASGALLCVMSFLASGFFALVGFSLGFRTPNDRMFLLIGLSCAALFVLFGISAQYYGHHWRGWLRVFPIGKPRSFLSALIGEVVGTLVLFAGIAAYRYSPFHDQFWIWSGLLLAGDTAVAWICYRRFERAFRSTQLDPASVA